jgi:hypothetical protein
MDNETLWALFMLFMMLLGFLACGFIGYKIGVWKGIKSQYRGDIFVRIEQGNDGSNILAGFMKKIN